MQLSLRNLHLRGGAACMDRQEEHAGGLGFCARLQIVPHGKRCLAGKLIGQSQAEKAACVRQTVVTRQARLGVGDLGDGLLPIPAHGGDCAAIQRCQRQHFRGFGRRRL